MFTAKSVMQKKSCNNCHQYFTIEPEDFAFYERIKVPPPTWCPECRLIRRMIWRNVKTLYKDQCNLCGKSIISMYAPEKPPARPDDAGRSGGYTVYCRKCWYGDGWDAQSYGMAYDPSRPFLDQYRELFQKVPRIALFQFRNTVDSDYANFTIGGKNLYLTFSAVEDEYCYYCYYIDNSRECFDCYNVMKSEACYECVDCSRCYRVLLSFKAHDSMDSAYLFDCVNCQNCFMSSNLRNKQYVFRNQQMTKEQYQKAMLGVRLGTPELQKEFQGMTRDAIHRFASFIKTTDCTGDNIENAKHSTSCFDLHGGENIKYGIRGGWGAKDSYDVIGFASELLYEGVASGFGSYNCKFFTYLDATRDATYVDWCHNSNNLFGCVGLRKKEYCILNKQYFPEEYKKLVGPILQRMQETGAYGEFFPISFSPFAYNETMAQEHFPLTKDEALAKGFAWRDPDPYLHKPTIISNKLLDV